MPLLQPLTRPPASSNRSIPLIQPPTRPPESSQRPTPLLQPPTMPLLLELILCTGPSTAGTCVCNWPSWDFLRFWQRVCCVVALQWACASTCLWFVYCLTIQIVRNNIINGCAGVGAFAAGTVVLPMWPSYGNAIGANEFAPTCQCRVGPYFHAWSVYGILIVCWIVYCCNEWKDKLPVLGLVLERQPGSHWALYWKDQLSAVGLV